MYSHYIDMWQFNPVYCPPIFELSEDLRRIKHKGTGLGGTDENELNMALCSVSTQRTFSVRILRSPQHSSIEIGMVQLDSSLHISGYKAGSWTLALDYQLGKCRDHEMDNEFKGKKILEGAVVTVQIDDKRRTLTFKVMAKRFTATTKQVSLQRNFRDLLAERA